MSNFLPWATFLAVAVLIYFRQARRDSVAARPANPRRCIAAICETCGRVEQTRNGSCDRCGAGVVKTIGNCYVPPVPAVAHTSKPAVVAGFGPLEPRKEQLKRELRQTLGISISCIESKSVN